MNDKERERLDKRYLELEVLIQDIQAGRVVEGDPAMLEGLYIEEKDDIEFELGQYYFERRDTQK